MGKYFCVIPLPDVKGSGGKGCLFFLGEKRSIMPALALSLVVTNVITSDTSPLRNE